MSGRIVRVYHGTSQGSRDGFIRPADLVSTEGYPLTDAERTALEGPDVGALYQLGMHPVLVNAFCRAMGWKRADYAVLFPAGLADAMRKNNETRWLTS